jgi:enolase-phosphatase E1
MSIKAIVTDIEGTTSSISFVRDVLFPYAVEHMADFIHANVNEPAVQTQLALTADIAALEIANTDTLIDTLLDWIHRDKKETPLKQLQGMIWLHGYRSGAFQAHMYPDATRLLKYWHNLEIPLYVYSSGSVQAQQLFFQYSMDGDLRTLFSGHFDTRIGHKKDPTSYQSIAADISVQRGIKHQEILFLSDTKGELDAAKASGWQTTWLIRDGQLPLNCGHQIARSFDEISLERF